PECFQAPQRELQNPPQLCVIQLATLEMDGRQVQLTTEHESGQTRHIGEDLHPTLHKRNQGLQTLRIEPPLLQAAQESRIIQILPNPQAVQPAQLVHIENRPTQGHPLDVE